MTTLSPWQATLSIAFCLLQAGCTSYMAPDNPSVLFTKVPAFGEGGPVRLEEIAGRITGTRSGRRIVIYARSGLWWVQPLAIKAFTPVLKDSTWKSQTHSGSAYAALLVTNDYLPRAKTEILPEKGGGILAVVMVEERKSPRPEGKIILFGGYEWHVRESPNEPGGTPNDYATDNAFTGPDGSLHLRITGLRDKWKSAEVNLPRSLGYGTYRLVVRNVAQLELASVFTMSIVGNDALASQMDIEISKWGETGARNGQFVIQPYYIPANTFRFQAPAGTVTFMLRWAPGRASFRTFRGAAALWESKPLDEHVFTSGVPGPGDDSLHLNLYVFRNNSHSLREGTEVIVEKFDYLP